MFRNTNNTEQKRYKKGEKRYSNTANDIRIGLYLFEYSNIRLYTVPELEYVDNLVSGHSGVLGLDGFLDSARQEDEIRTVWVTQLRAVTQRRDVDRGPDASCLINTDNNNNNNNVIL